MIQSATGMSVIGLAAQYDNVTSGSLTIVRDDALGVPGYDVYVPAARQAMRCARSSSRPAR